MNFFGEKIANFERDLKKSHHSYMKQPLLIFFTIEDHIECVLYLTISLRRDWWHRFLAAKKADREKTFIDSLTRIVSLKSNLNSDVGKGLLTGEPSIGDGHSGNGISQRIFCRFTLGKNGIVVSSQNPLDTIFMNLRVLCPFFV